MDALDTATERNKLRCKLSTETVTLELPESLYLRFKQAAQATRHTLNEVLLHAVQVGSPPRWDDAPAEFQADLATLDRMDDESLWHIVRSYRTHADVERHQELLDKNANGTLSAEERDELGRQRTEADRFMLRRVHAAALLRWRGYQIPSPDNQRDAA